MIKIILISISILSFIGLIIIGIIACKMWNKKDFEKIMSFIGLVWAILSIIITCIISLYSIKESNVFVSFTDGRYMDTNEEIRLIMNEDKSLDMNYTPDYIWAITLNNNGNIAVDKIRVKITFDNLYFSDVNQEYQLADGIWAFGGFRSLVYESDEWIPPSQKTVMPLIDFRDAYIIDENEDVIMNIYTYTEEDEVKEFSYKILITKE